MQVVRKHTVVAHVDGEHAGLIFQQPLDPVPAKIVIVARVPILAAGDRKKIGSIAMSFRGYVEKGVVVFDEPTAIPEGTVVEVVVCEVSPANVPVGLSLWDRLKDVAGKA
ncbi:MAG: hypothetical protein J5I93_23310 [Pirellulaceae bacterium]|nr:hypothetical protein [Pirellulaceae bacterium]